MADFVSYAAYQSLLMSAERRFMWEWYDRYLSRVDVLGGPTEL